MAERLIRWQARDGQLFDSITEAENHERRIGFVNFVENMVATSFFYNMPEEDIVEMILTNIGDIVDAYKESILLTDISDII